MILTGSTAASGGTEAFSVYAASKAAVRAFARNRILDHLASVIPCGRVAEPDEIARAAMFLALDDASFVNGIELFVDGGQRQIQAIGHSM